MGNRPPFPISLPQHNFPHPSPSPPSLPSADKGSPKDTIAAIRKVFFGMGFNDQEIVALSGAHALGRCHPDASGYTGPWTPTPTRLTNGYFTLLLGVPWTIKEWDGPMQFEDPSGKLMMLPSDIALVQDPVFRKFVVQYSKDSKLVSLLVFFLRPSLQSLLQAAVT